ncbi:MAG: chromate transporter [Chloroflexi bacterium]|nr:chromate transporter [Chloroflexota bacterium]
MVTSGELARTIFKLGATSFGGMVAHIANIQNELVERRRWLTREDFLAGLSMCQMLPGPTATMVAVYCGYRLLGVRGALIAAVGFLFPAFAILLILSQLYFQFGSTPQVAGMLRGMNPVVIALIAVACYRLGRTAITERFHVIVAILAFAFVVWLDANIVFVLLLAGAVGIGWERLKCQTS